MVGHAEVLVAIGIREELGGAGRASCSSKSTYGDCGRDELVKSQVLVG